MKILFAVSNENIAEAVKKEYQNNYKAQLITKNVYYFNAIIKELQNNKTYDVVIISEDLEPFANNNYDIIDKFLCDKLKIIREEAKNENGENLPIIFITTDRHILGDNFTTKLYEIGIYNALVGNDRSIENVCTLMFHPRVKHEAKAYYRVNSEIDSTPKDDDVKEEEIKNIIAHYKKLGKAEEKYVESFNNIASQYNDAQLKVIIRFLPLNVKAVLEAQSPKYQSLTTFANNYNSSATKHDSHKQRQEQVKEKNITVNTNNDRVMEQISSLKDDSNVIIPNAMNINKVRKIDLKKEENNIKNKVENENDIPTLPGLEKNDAIEEKNNDILPGLDDLEEEKGNIIEEEAVVKRGRGRPRKNPVNTVSVETPKRGRGRPKKVQITEVPEEVKDVEKENIEETNNLESQNKIDEQKENTEVIVDTILPGFEEEISNENLDSNNLDKRNHFSKIDNNDTIGNNEINNIENIYERKDTMDNEEVQKAVVDGNLITEKFALKPNSMSQKQSVRYENIEYIIPADKRIVSFIGTSKSGVSFIVNNLAHMLSSFNINVAILDLTKNKNSFYIYTNNEESLRNKAEKSIYSLLEGNAYGVKVNKNLTLYTALPTDAENFYEADKVLKTLIDNYSVVLIDCDYDTPIGYFDNSTDLFLVQNMDILTMQPLTTFLKELKAKGVLKDEKIRFISNMETKVKGVSSQILLSAISVYKDPGMSYTIDLFDKNVIKVFKIPFDIEAYNKYLTSLVECNISLTGYSKNILSSLKEIAASIYPLINTEKNNKKNSGYKPPSLDNYSSDIRTSLN